MVMFWRGTASHDLILGKITDSIFRAFPPRLSQVNFCADMGSGMDLLSNHSLSVGNMIKPLGRTITSVGICFLLGFAPTGHATPVCGDWELWKTYQQRFIQDDGRVIDFQGEQNFTTSEGQSYSLFFSLIANDREHFDTLLNWTRYNLAGGDMTARLPAWHWGKRDDGTWGILDSNPASDSNMWIAYTLLQAGKLWQEARYTAAGMDLLALIKKEEIVDLPGLGPMILPASKGFVLEGKRWRINPSYLPIHMLRAFAAADKAGPWAKIADNTIALLRASSPHGFTPDWVVYQAGKGWVPDTERGPIGSYDAIRVYLWAGMLHDADPAKPQVLSIVSGMHRHVAKSNLPPPEKVNTQTGKTEGLGPPGFSAALLPYLQALKDTQTLEQQKQQLKGVGTAAYTGQEPKYYDQVLTLFGLGGLEGRFQFDATGQLIPNWKSSCSS